MKQNYTLLTLFVTLFLSINTLSQNGLRFDGANDQVNCGNNTSIQITGNAITLEAWIYPTSWKTQVWQGNIINKEALSGSGYMLRCGASGTLNFNLGNGTSVWHELSSSRSVLTLNTWQHVAGTYDGSFMKIYVNGVVVDSIAKTISIANSTSNLGIGYAPIYPNSRNFPGIIDEARIWDVSRTTSEILATMNSELCVIPPSVKAYYRFNQGIAGGTNTTVTSLTDFSSNSNTGTLTNLALTGTSSNWVTGRSLTPGTIVGSINVSACGSYTMPDGRIITTPGTYYDTLPSSSPCDSLNAYVISFPPAIIRTTLADSGCLSYTTPMGQLITTSGTYYDTVSSVGGCDTTIRYNITISGSVNDSIFRAGARITSWDTWADHQWVRCDSNYKPIAGETGRFINTTEAGDYAVIVKRGFCRDTSECINISLTSLGENTKSSILIYPNPADNRLTIQSNFNLEHATIQIYNLSGKLVKSIPNGQSYVDITDLTKGIYFLQLTSENQSFTSKFIKN